MIELQETEITYALDFISPFNVQVLPSFEPQKVVVDGPGIRNGIPASLETSFRIDTREAGLEQPDVSIKVMKITIIFLHDFTSVFRIPKAF